MTSYTPAPWHHCYQAGLSFVLDTHLVEGQKFNGNVIVTETTNIRSVADHARIVACVNACAGIADPAAALALARDALKRAAYSLRVHGAKDVDKQCDEAIAALGPATP